MQNQPTADISGHPAYSGLAIDISNYTGRLDARACEIIQTAGVGLVVVRLSIEETAAQAEIAAQQVGALADAGIPWQGYVWAYFDMDPAEIWAEATRRLDPAWPGYHGATVWLDCEGAVPDGADVVQWLQDWDTVVRANNCLPGIYSTRLWWETNVPIPLRRQRRLFGGWEAWIAQWDGYRSCANVWPWPPFGVVSMKQTGEQELTPELGPHDVNWACHVV